MQKYFHHKQNRPPPQKKICPCGITHKRGEGAEYNQRDTSFGSCPQCPPLGAYLVGRICPPLPEACSPFVPQLNISLVLVHCKGKRLKISVPPPKKIFNLPLMKKISICLYIQYIIYFNFYIHSFYIDNKK